MILMSTAFAGGFEVAQQSTIAGGTGHAGVARVDAAAAWNNPAMLADGGGFRLGAGSAFAGSTIFAQSTNADDPWEARTEGGVGTPPHLYASYADGDWAISLAANTPFAGGVTWPATWPQRFDIVSSAPRFFRVAPAFAYRFGRLRLAVGPHFDVGGLEVLKATNHIAEEGSAHLRLDGSGWGVDASVGVEVSDSVMVGLSWKSQTRLSMDGEADFDVPAPFAPDFPDQTVSAEWALPDRFVLGVAWQGPLTVLVDVGLTRWSVNDELVFDFADDVTDDIVQTNGWSDSVVLRAGVEKPWDKATLRGGAYLDGVTGAPVPLQTLSPSSPDTRRVGITAGGGYRFTESVSADAFVEYLRLLAAVSESPDAPQAAYAGYAVVGGVGLHVEMGKKKDEDARPEVDPLWQ